MSLIHSPSINMNGLVLYLDAANLKSYPGSGTVWTDLSTNGNNGTLTNTPTYSSTNGGIISFDGISASIQIPSFNISGSQISIFSWFKFSSLQTGERSIIRKDNRWQLGFSNPSTNTVRCLLATSGTTGWVSTNDFIYPFVNDTWYYFGFVYDNGVTKVYVNGTNVKTITAITGSLLTNTTAVSIGGNVTGGITTNLNGVIPLTSVYNTALSDLEVLQNYNAIRGRYGVDSPGTVVATPQFVSSTSSSTNNLGSMPSYQAGDLLLLVGMQTGSSTESATPSGYTRINGGSSTGGVTAAATMWYKIAGASETAPSVSAGNICAMLVYRGVTGIGDSAVTAYNATTTSFVYPTLTMTGPSFVAAFAVNPTYNFSTPASMTKVEQFEDVAAPTTGSHAIAIIPTAGEVSSWTGVTSTIGAGRIGVAMSVEITT